MQKAALNKIYNLKKSLPDIKRYRLVSLQQKPQTAGEVIAITAPIEAIKLRNHWTVTERIEKGQT